MFFQVVDIGVPLQKPEQFINDTFHMYFLGGCQWKSFLEIEPHLIPETTLCAGAGAIRFMNTFIQNMLKKIEVLLHGCKLVNVGMRISKELLDCWEDVDVPTLFKSRLFLSSL